MKTTRQTSRDVLRILNPEQRRAATQTEGPVLVLAGAGSGKTKMLVHRIAWLVEGRRVDPGHIVAVTFTNKAADEMRERVRAYVGDAAKRVTVSTFHALCLRILREHAAKVGLPRRFAIYATSDQLGALRSATADVSIADDRFDLKRRGRAGRWRILRRVTARPAVPIEGVPGVVRARSV